MPKGGGEELQRGMDELTWGHRKTGGAEKRTFGMEGATLESICVEVGDVHMKKIGFAQMLLKDDFYLDFLSTSLFQPCCQNLN